MNEEKIFQWDKEAADQNARQLDKGRRLLAVIVVVNLALTFFDAVLNMQFMGILLQLVIAFFIFRGSRVAKGLYIVFAAQDILFGLVSFVWQDTMMDQFRSSSFYIGQDGFIPSPEQVHILSVIMIVSGVLSIAWGIFMLVLLLKNKAVADFLEYQKEGR